jgi:hypothetical protein
MKAQMLKLMIIISAFCGGCFLEPEVRYYPYTPEVYPAKTKDSPLIFDPNHLARRKYTKIGKLEVCGKTYGSRYTSAEQVTKTFIIQSLNNGADGVINVKGNSAPYAYQQYIPGYTAREQITAHHSGHYFGTGGSGHYSGSSTASVPVYHPGFTIQHSGIIYSLSGELITLLDKETFGVVGVLVDKHTQNLEGARIAVVYPGSPAYVAGVEKGDIITTVDGININKPEDLYNLDLKVGAPVTGTLLRNGKSYTVTVIPEKAYYGTLEKDKE